MIRNITIVMCLTVSLLGCAHVETLSPAGEQIKIVHERPPGCTDLGEIFGKSNADDSEEAMHGARADLRNRAAKLGASHVLLETSNSRRVVGSWHWGVEFLLTGQALRCPAH